VPGHRVSRVFAPHTLPTDGSSVSNPALPSLKEEQLRCELQPNMPCSGLPAYSHPQWAYSHLRSLFRSAQGGEPGALGPVRQRPGAGSPNPP
jgi:hypothetical protein